VGPVEKKGKYKPKGKKTAEGKKKKKRGGCWAATQGFQKNQIKKEITGRKTRGGKKHLINEKQRGAESKGERSSKKGGGKKKKEKDHRRKVVGAFWDTKKRCQKKAQGSKGTQDVKSQRYP